MKTTRDLALLVFLFIACWFVGNGVILVTCGWSEIWWGKEGYYIQPVCRPISELAKELTDVALRTGEAD